MSEQLEHALATFKPEFGNEAHIEVLKLIGKLNKEKKSLKEKKDAERKAKGQSAVEKRIEALEAKILYSIRKGTGDNPGDNVEKK